MSTRFLWGVRKSVLKLDYSDALCEYTKAHWIVHFKQWTLWYANYISIKLFKKRIKTQYLCSNESVEWIHCKHINCNTSHGNVLTPLTEGWSQWKHKCKAESRCGVSWMVLEGVEKLSSGGDIWPKAWSLSRSLPAKIKGGHLLETTVTSTNSMATQLL